MTQQEIYTILFYIQEAWLKGDSYMKNLVVANNIKLIIQKKGLKQKTVAKQLGMSEQKFSDMLNNRNSIKATDIVKLMEILQVSANELFQIEVENN